MPAVPTEWLPWYAMKTQDLPPSVVWDQPLEDMQIAIALHDAVNRGEARADEEERKAQKAKLDKEQWERNKKASMERTLAKAGMDR